MTFQQQYIAIHQAIVSALESSGTFATPPTTSGASSPTTTSSSGVQSCTSVQYPKAVAAPTIANHLLANIQQHAYLTNQRSAPSVVYVNNAGVRSTTTTTTSGGGSSIPGEMHQNPAFEDDDDEGIVESGF